MLQGYGTDRQREGLGERATNKGVSTERLGCDVPTLCISCAGCGVQTVWKLAQTDLHNIRHAFSGDIEKFEILSESFLHHHQPVDMWTTAATCMVSYCTDFVCQDSSFTTDYKPGPPRDSEETLPKDMQSTAAER